MIKKKFALIIKGRDENLGMMFVGGEVKECGHEFKFFDAEMEENVDGISSWKPDYICFSPLCIDEAGTLKICRTIKEKINSVVSVFGGPHISGMAASSEGELEKFQKNSEVDLVVVGPVRGAIDTIIERGNEKGLIRTAPTTPTDMPSPTRREFYEAMPRLASHYAKSMMSMFGCPFDCSFCSNYVKRTLYGPKVFKNYFLKRRPISELLKEGKVLLDYNTIEVDWEDDDILFGSDIEEWLPNFVDAWKSEIGLPIRFMSSPHTVLAASDNLLRKLREISCWAIIGVQCGDETSLKLINRAWQTEKTAKDSHDRLKSFGFSIMLQTIVGLPVEDPVEDAIQTVLALKRIGKGSFANAFPLLLYPGTKLYNDCVAKGLPIDESALQNLHVGLPSIKFSDEIINKIRNISKLVKIFVKFDMDESWIRALIEIDNLGDESNKKLAQAGFADCINARWDGNEKKKQEIADSIGTHYLKF